MLLFWAAIMVAYGVVFYYLPLAGWAMAFQDYKPRLGIFHSAFVGLDKFKMLFSDMTFIRVIRNTLAMGVINLVVTFVTAIAFAILLNEIASKGGKKVVQTISYLPHFLSWIIVTGILHDMLSGTGIVNEFLVNMHIIDQPINFFAHTGYFWPIVAFANVWKETGWNAIIYLAAITSIDPSLYEAASIDGAGRWAKIKYVTLPGIKPTIIILLLMNVGNVLNAGFEIQYLLGNGLIQKVSQTIDIYVLKWGISQGDYAIGTAAGIFKSVVSIILIFIANKLPNIMVKSSCFKEVLYDGRYNSRLCKEQKEKKISIFPIVNCIIMVLFLIITLYPVLNTLAISLNDGTDALRGGIYLLPRKFTWKNYITVLQKDNLITGAYITVARTIIGTVLALVANAILAFIVSRKRFLFKRGLSLFWVITMYVNGGLIPTFLLYKGLGLTNSFWVYVIPGMVSAFNMLVIRTYMNGIPDSLEESAQLDGAGYTTIFSEDLFPSLQTGICDSSFIRSSRTVELMV